MLNIFSTREIVTGFYIIIIIVYVFSSPKIRPSAINVIKAASSKQLIIPFSVMIIYAAVVVYVLTQFSFWKWVYIKDIIIWVLFAGVPVCFNAVSKNIENHYFRNMIIHNLKFTALVEFFVGSFTFNIVVEFIMQPVLILFILLQAVAGTKDEYKSAKKLINWIVTIFGFAILGFTIKNAIASYSEHGAIDMIVSFCIPIIFSLLYLPIAYGFAVFAKYEIIFIKMSFKEPKDKKIIRKHRLDVVVACKLSYKAICIFESEYIQHMYIYMEQYDFDELIKEFKKRTNSIPSTL